MVEEAMTMKPLGDEAMQLFSEILSSWRKQGRRIGWDELNQAAEMARQYEETREQQQQENDR